MIEPVRKSISVDTQIGQAFEIFTARLSEWWPLATHSIGNSITKAATVEGHLGGRIYEIHYDGAEADWGVVSIWEPPNRFGMEWKVNPEASGPTVISVHFTQREGGTEVSLSHDNWERLGDGAAEVRDRYDEGWDTVLAEFIRINRQYS